MNGLKIGRVEEDDLDNCYKVEHECYTTEGATRERIQKRIEVFPQGFLVAEYRNRIIGIINSGATNKEDITEEEFKDMIGHEKDGKNIAIFSVAVLPEFQGKGVSRPLMEEFIKVSEKLGKEKILLICKDDLIPYYKKYGFDYIGKSKSTHGGFEWHEMHLRL